jgi:hypothetical protein
MPLLRRLLRVTKENHENFNYGVIFYNQYSNREPYKYLPAGQTYSVIQSVSEVKQMFATTLPLEQ